MLSASINKNVLPSKVMRYTLLTHTRTDLGGTKEGNVSFNVALNTFYLRLHGVGHMVKEHSVGKETRCRHSFRLAATVLLYEPSHRQDCTYHDLCYKSRGALAETRNSSMGPPHEGSIHHTMSERSYHGFTSRSSTQGYFIGYNAACRPK